MRLFDQKKTENLAVPRPFYTIRNCSKLTSLFCIVQIQKKL